MTHRVEDNFENIEAENLEQLADGLSDLAVRGVLSVAPYLRKVARTVQGHETKRDIHDPVTVHDRAVESSLRSFFAAAIPGSRMLGEEFGEETLTARNGANPDARVGSLGARVRWIVDPIDGTANFASGLTYFGTSVAAELDGRVVAAAISIPCSRELFAANLTQAWHVDADEQKTALNSSGPKTESEALLVSYYPSKYALTSFPEMTLRHLTELTTDYMVVRRTGAGALDLAMVAAGWEGAVLGMSFGPWDVAAGIHLIRVAGGTVVNLNLGGDLPDGLRPALVASVGTLCAKTGERVLGEYVQAHREKLLRSS